MPAGKIAFYGRARVPRTRSGCLACRRRKVKCDEKKPTCQRCEASNHTCTYGLKLLWPDDAKLKGILLGREGAKRKQPHRRDESKGKILITSNNRGCGSSSSYCAEASYGCATSSRNSNLFLNTSFEDLSEYFAIDGLDLELDDTAPNVGRRSKISPKRIFSPGEPDGVAASLMAITEDGTNLQMDIGFCGIPPGLASLHISEQESLLFEFYINRMCSTCTLLDGPDNGYKNFIAPFSMDSPLVMKSIFAVSANHLRFHDQRYHAIALQYKGRVLRSLRNALSKGPDGLRKPEILSAILMLCFFDISDGCNPNWMTHLLSANRIFMQSATAHNGSGLDVDDIPFIHQYFASHNILAYTAFVDPLVEKNLYKGGSYWLSKIQTPADHIDCILGCSKEVLSIIHETSCRIRKVNKFPKGKPGTDLISWKICTESRLRQLTQKAPFPCESKSVSSADSLPTVIKVAETFRQATLILLQYFEPSCSRRQVIVKACVRKIIELMLQCPVPSGGARSCSLWSFFVAACHASDEEDRQAVLQRFYDMESRKRFGNVRPVREVVEHMYKQRDLRADELSSNNPMRGRCFEWEDTMAFLGANLSLT